MIGENELDKIKRWLETVEGYNGDMPVKVWSRASLMNFHDNSFIGHDFFTTPAWWQFVYTVHDFDVPETIDTIVYFEDIFATEQFIILSPVRIDRICTQSENRKTQSENRKTKSYLVFSRERDATVSIFPIPVLQSIELHDALSIAKLLTSRLDSGEFSRLVSGLLGHRTYIDFLVSRLDLPTWIKYWDQRRNGIPDVKDYKTVHRGEIAGDKFGF